MAYKPFKVKNGYFDYENEQKKESRYQIQRMKLFGFRSGLAWKMIPALIYYFVVGFIIIGSINGEIYYFEFEPTDIVLDILKYIFLTILLYSPAIFLSDFKYNKKIPLLKENSAGLKCAGMVIIILFCVFNIVMDMYCMSEKYVASYEKYYEEVEAQKKEKLEEFESQSRAQEEESASDMNK